MEEHTTFTNQQKVKGSMKIFFLTFISVTLAEVILHLVQKIQMFVLPIEEFLTIVIFLVIADWITGIRASVRRGEKVVAAKMQKSIEKLTLYFIAMLLSEGMKITFFPTFPITYITALSISVTEFKSNVENIENVTGVSIWILIKDQVLGFLKKK